jgi:SAM-dependent methyltransferase
MFDFHTDKVRYFEMQRRIATDYVLPFLRGHISKPSPWKVLEVGCAEAGVLKAFVDAGHDGTGIELSAGRAKLARDFLADSIEEGRARIIARDIYKVSPQELPPGGFDVIVLKDVIEHIPEQERMIPRLAEFLAPGGKIFFGFPPWMMPFGGHQQIAKHPMVARMPWIHLLPAPVYRFYVKSFGERQRVRDELQEIHDTRISIERFERIVKKNGLHVDARKLWLFNPIYSLKFGIKARAQWSVISAVPFVRNFVSTAAYYVISDPSRLSPKPESTTHEAAMAGQ